jgi:hypothetical protein
MYVCIFTSTHLTHLTLSQVNIGYGPFPPSVNFSKLDIRAGVKFLGQSAGDFTGSSVAGVGDLSGDGVEDVCMTATGNSAKAFCVYGWGNKSMNVTLRLSALTASTGLVIVGSTSEGDFKSIAPAGDVNGDGRRDLVLGAPYARNMQGMTTGAYIRSRCVCADKYVHRISHTCSYVY